MTKIKIMIIDDQEHVRQGLKTILELSDDMEVIGEACNGLESIQMAGRLKPDVVLMDLEMPEMNGLEAAQILKQRYPGIAVVMITIHHESVHREQAERMGVDAFLEKGESPQRLIQTIRDVLSRTSNDSFA